MVKCERQAGSSENMREGDSEGAFDYAHGEYASIGEKTQYGTYVRENREAGSPSTRPHPHTCKYQPHTYKYQPHTYKSIHTRTNKFVPFRMVSYTHTHVCWMFYLV